MSLPAPVVIFVEPQNSGNVGAIARVMSNFGINDLRLVGQPVKDNEALQGFSKVDWILACKGNNILENTQVFSSLADALHDVQIALASTGRQRDDDSGYSRPHLDMDDALDALKKHQLQSRTDDPQQTESSWKWALVIGRENDGLNDIEISHCQSVVNIPTSAENPSMNAAMATGCLLYHWFADHLRQEKLQDSNNTPYPTEIPRNLPKRLRLEKEHKEYLQKKPVGPFPIKGDYTEAGRNEWASISQLERFTKYLMETIELTDFVKYPDKEAVRARMRRWTQSAPIPVGELLFAFELMYHIRAKILGHFTKRDFLNDSPTSEKLKI